MLSVGRRDARKELGIGGGREMMMEEETELEEGEAACSYQSHNNHHNDDDDATMDPDVALSYLDEKLQHVLGHFQKDFEGGVSAENLGAKFGGYGSFLPSHRSPPKVQHGNNVLKSPNPSQLGAGHRSSDSSGVLQAVKPGPISASAVSQPSVKMPSLTLASIKQEGRKISAHVSEEVNGRETLNKQSNGIPDSKMLKFRIKVGSDKLSMQNNAAIYSGLGLNVSPSSSMEDSPSESEGMSHELHHTSFESPTHIIQIMTSFPVHDGLLLSPLSDVLIRLTERERLPRECGSISVSKFNPKMVGQEKIKFLERFDISSEPKNDYKKVSGSDFDIVSRMEMDLDSLACDRVVSDSMKLPLLSGSYSLTGVKASGRPFPSSKEVTKEGVQDQVVLAPAQEPLIPKPSKENGCIVNPKATSVCEVWEDKKNESLDSASESSRKGGADKGEKSSNFMKIDTTISNVRKTSKAESAERTKHRDDHKSTSHKSEGEKFPISKERFPSEGRKKSKKSQSQGNMVAEISKASATVMPYSTARSRKGSHADDSTEGEIGDLKVQKTIGKTRDRYSEFFGDMELEQEDNQLSPPETSVKNRRTSSHMVEKEIHGVNKALSEKSKTKKIDKMLGSEAYTKQASSAALHPQNGPTSDPAPVITAPVVEEQDNWVECVLCETWRLLPPGKYPDELPENWQCSMLDWLPKMNICEIGEEETTRAVRELYPVPLPNGLGCLPGIPGGSMSRITLSGVPPSKPMTVTGRKKHGLKEPSNSINKDGPMQLSHSAKKAVVTCKPSGSSNEVCRSPRISEPDLVKSSRTSEAAMVKQKPKLKEKHSVHENFSYGGEVRQSKMKSKRVSDEEIVEASKKMKTESFSEDPMSDYAIEKVGKMRPKHTIRSSSKDSKSDEKDQNKVSAKLRKDELHAMLDVGSTDRRKQSDAEIMKKRKIKEEYDANLPSSSPVSTGPQLREGGIISKEEFSDSDYRKEKKARVSISTGKEASAVKGDRRIEKKGSHGKKQQSRQDFGSTLSQRSVDGVESLKKDSGTRRPPVAATSSSSKVSGSHKTKGNIPDIKGSPVESVSSLPIGTPKPDKHISAARKNERRANRKCSDGEDEGFSDRLGNGEKDKSIDFSHGSLDPSYVDFPDKDFGQVLPCAKAKQQIVPSVDITNGNADSSGKDTQRNRPENVEKCHNEERPSGNHSQSNGSRPRKSAKGSSSSRSKDRSFDSSFDNGRPRLSDSTTAHAPYSEVQLVDNKNKAVEKIGSKHDRKESRYIDKSSAALSANGKTDFRSNLGGHSGSDKGLATDSRDAKPNLPPEDRMTSGKEKSISANPCGGIQEERLLSIPGSHKGNGGKVFSVSNSEGDNPSKSQKQTRKVDYPPNGIAHSVGNQMSNGLRIRDHDAPSPVKRDSSSQAANNALKEAKNLKHLADRLKNSGSIQESMRLYFEASLKFLHGASLLESGSNENAKDLIQSLTIYTSTAKLFEFCAYEYEKSRDMAAAALAYKCMEVAHMRVIHCSHSSANRDRHELQMALQMIPTGESPSSSASDIDNLNHPTTVDKVTLGKGISSPQVTGSLIVPARNRPNVTRLLTFTQNVNFAMEASRKSRTAFAAASISLGDSQSGEGITSIKTALDFSFHDVEGLLRLIRLAVEAISR
ncbi:Cysteine-tryptophan domain-containing zinc finger protein 3 [Linum perenne]